MSNSRNSTGTTRLLQDIGNLLNNRQGSDVQFKVGGGAIDPSEASIGETIIDPSAATTLYAHSAILRCRSRHFASIFENNKEWREHSSGVIYKPNMSPSVFYKVLDYIYTGDVQVKTDNLFELLSAAEEMELDELSIECQKSIIIVLKDAFSNEEESIDNITESDSKKSQNPKQQRLPINIAVRKILIPALTLTQNQNLSAFFQQILTFAVSHIGTIFASLDTRIIFFERIPTPIFQQILASDILEMQDYDIWELAFSLACHKTNVSKLAVETYFKSNFDHGKRGFLSEAMIKNGSSDLYPQVSEEQLKQLKVNLMPLLPAVRFSLMKDDQYSRIAEILNFFLPRRRSMEFESFHPQPEFLNLHRLNREKEPAFNIKQPEEDLNPFLNISRPTRRSIELQRFHSQSDKTRISDLPPLNIQHLPLNAKSSEDDSNPYSNIIKRMELWQLMKTWISESNEIKECLSARDVKLSLLFRASEHGFSGSAFHKHCNNKGPTIVIVKSDKGHLFGGVNFADWKSDIGNSSTTSNFLFALADGYYRKNTAKFLYNGKGNQLRSSYGIFYCGPVFGQSPYDLVIIDKANILKSYSRMPQSYYGAGASNTSFAGEEKFMIAEYEVFSISKR